MKEKTKFKAPYLPLAGVLIVLLIAAVVILTNLPPDETQETKRIQEFLSERYNTSFVYDGKEVKNLDDYNVQTESGPVTEINGKNSILYYFHPADNDQIRFYATHGKKFTYESKNEVVISNSEWCYDNFEDAVIDNTFKTRQFELTYENKDLLAEQIYQMQTDLIDKCSHYNIDYDYIQSTMKLYITFENNVYDIKIYSHSLPEISEQLEEFF